MNDFRTFKIQVTATTPQKTITDYAYFTERTAAAALERAKALAAKKWKQAYKIEAEIVLA